MVAPSAGGSRLPWQRTPTTNPFLTNSKKIRRSKRATNTHKHGPGSYLSDGTRGDSQSHAERDPLRSKDRGLFTYNILDGYPASLGFPIMHRVHVISHNCHDIKLCHPPDKQYTEFRIYTCSLFFICNNKVAMARARCGIGCEYTVYSGYLF